jgi:hypothetical protein
VSNSEHYGIFDGVAFTVFDCGSQIPGHGRLEKDQMERCNY